MATLDLPETLWRGDQTRGRVVPVGLFRTSGILSKLGAGGDPGYVRREGLLRSIQAHVAPEPGADEHFSATSPFLSFTASYERARDFARGRARRVLIPCGPYDHEAVIFALSTHGARRDGDPGCFRLTYRCDPTLIEPTGPGEDAEDSAAHVRCEFCLSGPRDHVLELVNVAVFLRRLGNRTQHEEAVARADRDAEWLVLPRDYVERLEGDAGVIPRARIWSYEVYRFA
jgi:hypothetical protein